MWPCQFSADVQALYNKYLDGICLTSTCSRIPTCSIFCKSISQSFLMNETYSIDSQIILHFRISTDLAAMFFLSLLFIADLIAWKGLINHLPFFLKWLSTFLFLWQFWSTGRATPRSLSQHFQKKGTGQSSIVQIYC